MSQYIKAKPIQWNQDSLNFECIEKNLIGLIQAFKNKQTNWNQQKHRRISVKSNAKQHTHAQTHTHTHKHKHTQAQTQRHSHKQGGSEANLLGSRDESFWPAAVLLVKLFWLQHCPLHTNTNTHGTSNYNPLHPPHNIITGVSPLTNHSFGDNFPLQVLGALHEYLDSLHQLCAGVQDPLVDLQVDTRLLRAWLAQHLFNPLCCLINCLRHVHQRECQWQWPMGKRKKKCTLVQTAQIIKDPTTNARWSNAAELSTTPAVPYFFICGLVYLLFWLSWTATNHWKTFQLLYVSWLPSRFRIKLYIS